MVRKTILAVAKNKTDRDFYQTKLRIYYNLLLEENGEAALQTVRNRVGSRESIDLIVTDAYLSPEMNGHQLIREVHKISPRTKYVLVGKSNPTMLEWNLQQYRKQGIEVQYLQKPLNSDNLSAVLSLIGV